MKDNANENSWSVDQRMFEISESLAFWRDVIPDRDRYGGQFHDCDGVVVEASGMDRFLSDILQVLDSEISDLWAELIALRPSWGDDRIEMVQEYFGAVEEMIGTIRADLKDESPSYWARKDDERIEQKYRNKFIAARPPMGPLSQAVYAMAWNTPKYTARYPRVEEKPKDWQVVANDVKAGAERPVGRLVGETTGEYKRSMGRKGRRKERGTVQRVKKPLPIKKDTSDG